jgi:hypothetical protein
MTHFGFGDDVDDQLDEVASRLDAWAELARDSDEEAFIGSIEAEIEADAGRDVAAAYVQAAPPQQLYAGLSRYWRKRAESASVS